MKSIILSVFIMASFVNEIHAQFDEYKYVIVPKRFDGFKKENQYNTSTLVKHLLAEKGFTVYYDDNLPADLNSDRCLGLYVHLYDKSSMFTTKTSIALRDCSGQEVFTTMQGKSKKKEYIASFDEAITGAFRSFNQIEYNYKPKSTEMTKPVTMSFKNDIKKLDERPNLNKNQDPMVEQEATADRQYYKDRRPIESNIKEADANVSSKEMVEQVASKEEQRYENNEPVPSEFKKADSAVLKATSPMTTNVGVLYAQAISNGYQLVDSTPKIRMQLLKSSSPNVYLAESGDLSGVVYSEAGKWFFEYYQANTLVTQELEIKF